MAFIPTHTLSRAEQEDRLNFIKYLSQRDAKLAFVRQYARTQLHLYTTLEWALQRIRVPEYIPFVRALFDMGVDPNAYSSRENNESSPMSLLASALKNTPLPQIIAEAQMSSYAC